MKHLSAIASAIRIRLLPAALALTLAAGCASPAAGAGTATLPAETASAAPAAGNPAAGLTVSADPAQWSPADGSPGIRFRAADGSGAPVAGDWTAARGAFLPSGGNGDGETAGLSEVLWTLPEAERGESGAIEVRFAAGGRVTVLIVSWDAEAGRASVGEGVQPPG